MMFSRPRPISQSIVRRKLARSSTTRVSACLAPPESRLRGTGHPHHDPVYDRPARSRHGTCWAPAPHAVHDPPPAQVWFVRGRPEAPERVRSVGGRAHRAWARPSTPTPWTVPRRVVRRRGALGRAATE